MEGSFEPRDCADMFSQMQLALGLAAFKWMQRASVSAPVLRACVEGISLGLSPRGPQI